MSEIVVDCVGLFCPRPIIDTAKAMRPLAAGAELLVLADDPSFPEDIASWSKSTGHPLVALETHAGVFRARLLKP